MNKLTVLLFICFGATAQVTRHGDIPLKNWSAPPYWQPTTSEATGGLNPQVRQPQSEIATGPLVFVAMTPCRVVDTRASQHFPDPFGAPSLVPGIARTFTIQTNTLCPVPATAQAYSFNVTVVPPGPLGFLTIYPHGQPQPNAVTLDDLLGTIVNNAAIVPAGTPSGAVDVVVNASTDVVLDINGYYAPPTRVDPGSANTATGYSALISNTTGNYNTANGFAALFSNTFGNYNTANGTYALYANTFGGGNAAFGYNALSANTTGSLNTALGMQALALNTTGGGNTAVGNGALFMNTVGNGNIAVGSSAGEFVTGNQNIEIGNDVGTQGDNGIIRIGNHNVQIAFFAAGIRGVTPNQNNGVPVYIDSNGQFGTAVSSRRFKEDIQDMSDASTGVLRLRPVTYRYQKAYADGSKPIDYGLIAEEVAEIYPDLVVTGADGKVETVQYQKLTPMLLNELQKEHAAREQDHDTIRSLQTQVAALQKALEALTATKVQGEPAR